jgi:hypothetical protein
MSAATDALDTMVAPARRGCPPAWTHRHNSADTHLGRTQLAPHAPQPRRDLRPEHHAGHAAGDVHLCLRRRGTSIPRGIFAVRVARCDRNEQHDGHLDHRHGTQHRRDEGILRPAAGHAHRPIRPTLRTGARGHGQQAYAMVLLLGLGTILGFRIKTNPWSVLVAFGLLLAFSFALSWVVVYLGVIVSDPEHVQNIGFAIVFPLVCTSGAFVPKNTMPSWLDPWVDLNPAGQLVDAMRGLLAGPPGDRPRPTHAGLVSGSHRGVAPAGRPDGQTPGMTG